MYSITEQQVEYILNNIKSRGITLESLQQDILDHVCCILENEYKGEGSFEDFYDKTITQFYKNELKEIESETVLQLTFKNYYGMKKAMIYSGAFSVITFLCGSVFKAMHWPGAGVLIALAIISSTMIFLPLMFIFKSRQESSMKEKVILATGSFAMILFCMGVLFRIQHWPGALVLWISAIAISFLVFIPLYFFNGIRRPETKVNTILMTVLMVLGTGIQFSLINVNPASKQLQYKMYGYLQNEEIINRLQKSMQAGNESNTLVTEIVNDCEMVKKLIVQNAIGQPVIPADFESRNILMEDGNLGTDFVMNNRGANLVLQLKNKIERFNASVNESKQIPIGNSIFDIPVSKLYTYSNSYVLNNIYQVEMFALLAE